MPRKIDEATRYFIYGLRDPRTAEIRYVGQTSIGITRPQSHSRESVLRASRNLHMVRWLRMIGTPEIVVLERFAFVTEDATTIRRTIDEAEIRWIEIGRAALGKRFVNLTAGGGGMHGHKFSEASREKMRASGKALAQTPERKAHLAAMTEKARDPAIIAKRVASQKQFYSTPDGKAILERKSVSQSRRIFSPDYKRAISDGLRRHWSDPVARDAHAASVSHGSRKRWDSYRDNQLKSATTVIQAWRLELGMSLTAAARLLHVRNSKLRHL